LAPGAIVFSLLSETGLNEWLPFLGFLIPVFSGLRLAKFNIDDRQTTSFIGLPVPANAIFWAGLVYSFSPFLLDTVWLLLILIIVFSYLLVSELPMFSLKFRNVSWADNQTQYIFLIGCVAILGYFQTSAFSIIIGWYIASSIGINLSKKLR